MLSLRDDPLLKNIPEVDGFKVLEPCVLYSKLGEGGMGAVYRGRHLNLDIDVAVKCLRSSLADQSAAFVQRFQREARLAAGIHHQNLVQVYDVSQKSGVHYLVMEFVHGETARDRVRRKSRLGIDEALRIALGAATGLGEAHARRIVHRDVKPDNVLIGRDGSVKVSDLGLAKAIESEVDVSLTQGVMGTPQYMAPEQWEDSSSVTPAADVWALGATIWFLLAGTDPIRKGTMQQVYKAVCVEPFPDIRAVRPEVSEDVARLIARCTARAVPERFADCREVLAELRRHVGMDRGELVSHAGETTQMGATLVSPPPPATMAKIRSQVESKTDFRMELQPPTIALEPTPQVARQVPAKPAEAPKSAVPAKRMQLVLGAVFGVALLAVGLFFALPDREPGPLPPDTNAMRVSFDALADPAAGYLSASRRFSLTGSIAGKDRGLRPRIRERGGKVTLKAQGAGRFLLDFDFDRDGDYTLELEGERLEGVRSLALTVDATKPTLSGRKEDPADPLPRGELATLTLTLSEPLRSAVIAGVPASIDGRVASARVRAPMKGSAFTVAWTAVDLAGNEAANKYEVRLEPEPEASKPVAPASTSESGGRPDLSEDGGRLPSRPAVVEERTEDPPPARPDPRPNPVASAAPPPGCIALGDETVSIGGRLWPKRIEHGASTIKFVLIPPGKFLMGSSVPGDNATAPRNVTITRGFYMAEDEVSEAEYARVTKSGAPSGSARMPVSNLSWNLAKRFCDLANLELPTEAEWEYACRAGSTTTFAFGDTLAPRQGATALSAGQLQPCGFSERNDFGLADMHGNLREFCADSYVPPGEYAKLTDVDPLGKRGREGVLRGGSFVSKAELCTSATRRGVDKTKETADAGVRPILRLR